MIAGRYDGQGIRSPILALSSLKYVLDFSWTFVKQTIRHAKLELYKRVEARFGSYIVDIYIQWG